LFWIAQLVILTVIQAAGLKSLIPVAAESPIVEEGLRDLFVLGLCGVFFLTSFAMIMLRLIIRMWNRPVPICTARIEPQAAAA
jgi:hypothetical protein